MIQLEPGLALELPWKTRRRRGSRRPPTVPRKIRPDRFKRPGGWVETRAAWRAWDRWRRDRMTRPAYSLGQPARGMVVDGGNTGRLRDFRERYGPDRRCAQLRSKKIW